MRPRPPMRGFWTATGVSIALLAMLCASPTKANAGCSQFVVTDLHFARLVFQLDILASGDEVDALSQAPARPRPCSGLLCSGKSALPGLLPIVGPPPLDGVVSRLTVPAAVNAHGSLLAYAERIVRAVIEGPSIDRPPR